MSTEHRHEIRHAWKEWPGTLHVVVPCLLSTAIHPNPRPRHPNNLCKDGSNLFSKFIHAPYLFCILLSCLPVSSCLPSCLSVFQACHLYMYNCLSSVRMSNDLSVSLSSAVSPFCMSACPLYVFQLVCLSVRRSFESLISKRNVFNFLCIFSNRNVVKSSLISKTKTKTDFIFYRIETFPYSLVSGFQGKQNETFWNYFEKNVLARNVFVCSRLLQYRNRTSF
jgi:hypothetical protein